MPAFGLRSLNPVVNGRRPRWLVRGVLGVRLVVVDVTFRNPWFFGNFGVVEPLPRLSFGPARCQPPRLIAHYHLASVLNLRGGSQDDRWYSEEVRATRECGINFYDLPMSATRRPLVASCSSCSTSSNAAPILC